MTTNELEAAMAAGDVTAYARWLTASQDARAAARGLVVDRAPGGAVVGLRRAACASGSETMNEHDVPLSTQVLHLIQRRHGVTEQQARVMLACAVEPEGWTEALRRRGLLREPVAESDAAGDPPKPYDLAVARAKEVRR